MLVLAVNVALAPSPCSLTQMWLTVESFFDLDLYISHCGDVNAKLYTNVVSSKLHWQVKLLNPVIIK